MPVSQHFGPIVEAGGGAGFSADCAAALAKCGLNPDSFGSYSHVASQIDAAKQACADWDIARKSGNLAGATPPTAEQRFLSQCESGHIMQNATGQRASADRNNYCDNVIDGYDAHAAPAMPMHDGAEGRSGHGIATRMETSQATARGTPGTVCYNEADRRADQQARARAVVEDHTRRMNNAERWAAKQRDAQAQAAGGTGPGGPGTGGGGAGGAAPAGATQPKKYSPTSADLDLAAECIAAMAAWTEENMKATCAASAAANAQRAASPEHAAEASRLRQEATDARRDHRAARSRVMSNTNPDGTPMTPAQQAQARRDMEAANHRAIRAEAAAGHAESLGCYANQGNRIAAGSNNTTGRIPGRAPRTSGGSTGGGSTAM